MDSCMDCYMNWYEDMPEDELLMLCASILCGIAWCLLSEPSVVWPMEIVLVKMFSRV